MRITSLFLVLGGLVACESVESTDVLTSGVYADITATDLGEGSVVTDAVLRVGGGNSNTFMNLEGDDALTSTHGEDVQNMIEVSLGDLYSYTAEHADPVLADDFVVGFERTLDEGAPATTLTVPDPFELTAPEADTTFASAQEDITITWEDSGSDDDMILIVTGDCFFNEEVALDGDTGTAVLEAGTLEWADDTEPETCQATLTIRRSRAGDLDPAYGEGGVAVGRQDRSVNVLVEP
ncbi:MAG: hypothetical protein GY913_13355 [Proteobacteria bacterium]|nr:hypothetical protein [Pseudomonadota bacterium]MCP4917894.1 hypothetical protein [Pseudomonadota bacterium]